MGEHGLSGLPSDLLEDGSGNGIDVQGVVDDVFVFGDGLSEDVAGLSDGGIVGCGRGEIFSSWQRVVAVECLATRGSRLLFNNSPLKTSTVRCLAARRQRAHPFISDGDVVPGRLAYPEAVCRG